MSSFQAVGFFSYAHADDYRDRLQELREDICAEYRIITGEELSLYIDRMGLTWGKKWDEELMASVDNSSFFVPVLSPSYFSSIYCRKELTQFLSKVSRLGGGHLVLPILYAPGLNRMLDGDDLAAEVLRYQYEDWTEIRLESRDSSRYRSAINRMAQRLASTSINSEPRGEQTLRNKCDSHPGDSDFGKHPEELRMDVTDSLEYLTRVNSDRRKDFMCANELLDQIGEHIQRIGTIAACHALRIVEAKARDSVDDEQAVLRDMARELSPVAEAFVDTSHRLFETIFKLDQSIRILVNSPLVTIEDYEVSMGDFALEAKQTYEELDNLRNDTNGLRIQSRLLHNPLNAIERAIVTCMATIDVMLDWGRLNDFRETKASSAEERSGGINSE